MLLPCLALGLSLAGAGRVHGAPAIKITMPTTTKPTPAGIIPTVNGLALTLDCAWSGNYGYQPFRLEVTCTPPSTGDRTLTVELASGMGGYKSLVATADVEIPAGSTSVTKIIPFPQNSIFYSLSLDVWEDGSHLDDLSFKNQWVNNTMRYQGMDAPALLFVSSRLIDVSQLDFMADPNSNNWNPTGRATLNTVSQSANFTYLPAADLIEDWINYSSLDVIFLSFSDVADLVANRPRVWQAIRQWVWTGGNVCIYGVDVDWSGLAKLDAWFECPPRPSDGKTPLGDWRRPSPELYFQPVPVKNGVNAAVAVDDDAVDEKADAQKSAPQKLFGLVAPKVAKKKKKPAGPSDPAPFVSKPVRLGQVVALADDRPFPGVRADWQWMFNTIGEGRWKWQYRHGLSPGKDNPGFDEFLIADIGLPPVKSYRVLITLFVIGIGPLNYWLLRRRGRLHLLLFTVPAAAIVVSTGLIGYVLLADGLESRIRARSYTELDQRNHEAASWSRLSYYTGLAPSRGLLFPADTALVPLEKEADLNGWNRRTRYLAWTPEQHLQRGWLASRTPTQYLTVRACATPSELRIVEDSDSERAAVDNRLGTAINHVLLCDSAGRMHYGRDIGPLDKASLQALDTDVSKATALEKMQRAMNLDAPRLPPQAPSDNTRFFFGMRINRYSHGTSDSSPANSLLEDGMRRSIMALNNQSLAARTYLAIVERPPEVNFGMDGLIESESTHVIFGSW